jgi:hypothetical protein
MLDGAAFVMGGAVLANMLDTPISKLAVSKHINFCQYLFDSWTLRLC